MACTLSQPPSLHMASCDANHASNCDATNEQSSTPAPSSSGANPTVSLTP